MGALMIRGNYLSLLRSGQQLLSFNNDQFQRVQVKSNMNTGAHIAGALIAQAEMISGSLKVIEKYLVKESGKLSSSKVNVNDLRKMIEELGNVEKMIK